MTEDDPEIVVHGTQILARLLVVHGAPYVSKFADKSGGFTIMRSRLRRWWDIPTLWPICFSILFGRDVANIDFERSFDLFNLLETFDSSKVIYPKILPVITAMLQHGLNDVLRRRDEPESPVTVHDASKDKDQKRPSVTRRMRSMSLTKELESRRKSNSHCGKEPY